jgi:hypothetical protein
MPITGVTNPFTQNEAALANTAIDELASKAAAGAELFASYYYVSAISASLSFPIFVAPFALQVKQASIMTWNLDVAADDVNYWRLAVRRSRGPTTNEIASKSTQLTGGEAITLKTEWNYDAVTFSPTASIIGKGDAVDLAVFKTGTPANLSGTLCTVRYEPL